jgi:hypothetical protein
MTYTQLKTNIEDVVENSFTTDQLNLFIQQAEQKIYNSVDFPALRKNVEGTTTSSNKYLTVPTDILYVYSLAIISNSEYIYLLHKDVNFIREAYPNQSTTGIPKHYSYFSDDAFILGPTPNAGFTTELHYSYYPESIVTASSTPWLGTNFDSALLNGSLVEAVRFLKSEPDIVAMYTKMYNESLLLLGQLSAKTYKDEYRSETNKRPKVRTQ